MSFLRVFFSRIGGLFRNDRFERELDEEMRTHLDMLIEENIHCGMNPEEARYAALRSFGGIEPTKERYRDQRTLPLIETLMHDVRFGFRMLRKNPGFTFVAVITLALGIGANTAIFSVVYSVLLKPLPYHEPERLVMLWTKLEQVGVEQTWVSEPEVLDFREQAELFEGFGMFNNSSFVLTGAGDPEQLVGANISYNFFSLLGASVKAGREFAEEDEQAGAAPVALLSHGFWLRRFGGQQSVIGSTIYLSARPATVVGVLPPDFALMLPSETQHPTNIDVWVPYNWDYARHGRHHRILTVIGRIKPGVSLEQAQEEMRTIAARLYPLHYTRTGFALKVVPLHGDIVKKQRPALLLLLAAVGFVLLIACANVANLLLARAAVREREMALRAALGAGRIRLVRQLLIESIMLALFGGAVGMLLAVWGLNALLSFTPADLPRLDEVGINFQVLAFTCAVTALTGIMFGLIPALRASNTYPTQALKDGSRNVVGFSSRRLRGALVVAEIALSLVLLIGAGLLMRSFLLLIQVDPGFDARNVLTMSLYPARPKYKDGVAVANFYQQVVERIQALPGVEAASAIHDLPLSNDSLRGPLTFEGVTANAERANLASSDADQSAITPNYFKTMRTPLLAGRFFTSQDVKGKPPVAIIDETLSQRLWPNASPIGRRLTFGRFPEKPDAWVEIVGVVRRIRRHRLDADVGEQVYFPHAQSSKIQMTLAIRTAADPLSMVDAVRGAVQSVDRDQPVYRIRPMAELVDGALATARFILLLLMIFAGVAAALAVVGIYGVMSNAVTQRTQEIGVRMALGALRFDILRLVLKEGVFLTLIGVGLGLIGSLALTQVLVDLLFGVSATDPLTFAGMCLLILLVALLATWLPARRATRIDLIVALKYE